MSVENPKTYAKAVVEIADSVLEELQKPIEKQIQIGPNPMQALRDQGIDVCDHGYCPGRHCPECNEASEAERKKQEGV